jgi:hypothetical protein
MILASSIGAFSFLAIDQWFFVVLAFGLVALYTGIYLRVPVKGPFMFPGLIIAFLLSLTILIIQLIVQIYSLKGFRFVFIYVFLAFIIQTLMQWTQLTMRTITPLLRRLCIVQIVFLALFAIFVIVAITFNF